jgi:hypothetical protein
MKATRLVWKTLYTYKDVAVMPCRVSSPLRQFVANDAYDHAMQYYCGITMTRDGLPDKVDLLQWHAQHAFSGVNELTLRRLVEHAHLGDEVQAGVAAASDYCLAAIMRLMQWVDDSISEDVMLERVSVWSMQATFEADAERFGMTDEMLQPRSGDLHFVVSHVAPAQNRGPHTTTEIAGARLRLFG